jgi:hypothetical protein
MVAQRGYRQAASGQEVEIDKHTTVRAMEMLIRKAYRREATCHPPPWRLDAEAQQHPAGAAPERRLERTFPASSSPELRSASIPQSLTATAGRWEEKKQLKHTEREDAQGLIQGAAIAVLHPQLRPPEHKEEHNQ